MRHPILTAVTVLFAVFVAGTITNGPVHAAKKSAIFATTPGRGEATLYSIDAETGETTEIGDVGFNRISAIDFDDNGTLYGVGENADGDSVLITIDTDTGEGTLVGETGVADDFPGCTYDEDSGTFYLFGEDGDLYEIDLSDGSATLVGSDSDTAARDGNSIGVDASGDFYHCMSEELWSFDATDGSHTFESDMTFDTGDSSDYIDGVRGMDWDESTSAFKAVVKIWDESGSTYIYYLADIDPSDASMDLIATTGNMGSIAVTKIGRSPEITAGPTATPTKVSLADGSVSFSVTATDADGDALTYEWDFDDGSSGTGASPTHVYTAPGIYTAVVTVTDGANETPASVVVTVNSPPTLTVGPTVSPPVVSPTAATVDFSVTALDANGDPMTYLWSFGDGATATTASASHTYAAMGEYTVGLTVSDGIDDTTWTGTVRVNSPPVFDPGPSADPALVGIGEDVTFHGGATDADGDAIAYDWDFGDGSSGSNVAGGPVTHFYLAAGAYTAVVTASDGLDPATGSVEVVVAETIDIGKVSGKLNFKKAGKDRLTLKGEVALPAEFVTAGKELRVDFGGVPAVFLLDAKGKAKNDDGKAKLKFKKKTGLWSYVVTLKNGDFAAAWADDGLADETVKAKPVEVKTTLWVDGIPFVQTATFSYSGKSGKSGKVK
jgi:PKD repeat protein